MSSDIESAYALDRAIHRLARHLDERDFEAFLAVMLDEAEYLVTAKAPELEEEMTWMHLEKQELAERLVSIDEHQWEIATREQTRLISINHVEKISENTRTSANLVIYNTDASGQTECYAVGSYEDNWCYLESRWRLRRRQVVLKTRQIYPLSPLPL